MAGLIPEETITEVQQSLDIVDVVSEHLQLKKQGKHYIGLCPFHGEKTPSFSVSPDKQLYHCFGCGAGGNAITFVMEMEGLSFAETVKTLADKNGIAVPDAAYASSGPGETGESISRSEGHELAARFYHHVLMNTEQGKQAYDYLEARGITAELMERFQLGFSPDQPEVLKGLLDKRGFDLEQMEEQGLLYRQESSGELRDRFRNRIMFPIRDLRGRTVGFGGRTLGGAEPKYLNSPDSALFHKNELLYGFDVARKAVRRENTAVLFEGYSDVIAANKAGVDNGLASLGTSLTDRQAQIIRRNTERIIICYDGDNAGQEAAWRAGEVLEKQGLNVEAAMLPAQTDPDDYIQMHGMDRFQKEIIETALPFMSFKIQALKKDKNLQDEGDKLRYIEEVLKEMTALSRAVERDFYLRQLADEFSLSLDALKQEQYRIYKDKGVKRHPAPTEEDQEKEEKRRGFDHYSGARLHPAHHNAERYLLAHMMRDRDACMEVQEKLGGDFNLDHHAALAAHLYAYYGEGHQAETGSFINHLSDPELIKEASEIAMLDITEHMSENELADYVDKIKNYPKWVEIEQIHQKLKEAERNQDVELAAKLGNEMINMKKALKK
ncbi:DNA primase [Salibacterium qingdaonense]|uniref:DNA primase n=1 Tax=Salibacterium qingdaonense TaxID=266892 RepID=A0A1I4JJB1_9BACI|nr:DNA primase [Salibacterium qingdaonense]SFL66640.1 DNA primase [Salibacterium qingdaonense]